MCACVHVCMHVCVHVCMHVCMCVRGRLYVRVWLPVRMCSPLIPRLVTPIMRPRALGLVPPSAFSRTAIMELHHLAHPQLDAPSSAASSGPADCTSAERVPPPLQSVQRPASLDVQSGADAQNGADALMVAPPVDDGRMPSATTDLVPRARLALECNPQLQSLQRAATAADVQSGAKQTPSWPVRRRLRSMWMPSARGLPCAVRVQLW